MKCERWAMTSSGHSGPSSGDVRTRTPWPNKLEALSWVEPSHGSAPKYAGLYKVNPIATILSGKMMLDWLGETEKGSVLEQATAEVIQEGKVRTYDMGGSNSTLEMGEAIAAKLG